MASCQQKPQPPIQVQTKHVSCKAYPNHDLGIILGTKCNKLRLVTCDYTDPKQIWEKIEIPGPILGVFALVNKAIGQIVCANGDEVVPIPDTNGSYPENALWTEEAISSGYSYIKTIDGSVVWNAEGVMDTKIMLRAKTGQANQQWNFRNILPVPLK